MSGRRLMRASQRPPPDRHGKIDFVGNMRGRGLRLRLGVERRIVAEHAEGEALRPDALQTVGRRVRHRIDVEPPHEHADAGDVVTPQPAMEITRRTSTECASGSNGPVTRSSASAVAQVGGARPGKPQMVDVLGPAEQGVELHRPRRPAGDVVRQLLEQRKRALAPAKAERVRHLAPRNQDAVEASPLCRTGFQRGIARLLHRAIADQVADVRHDPVFAGLDEPVLVELRDIVLDDIHLLADDPQQRAQRIVVLRIAHAVHDGQQFVQAVEGAAHDLISCRISVSGTSDDR